MKTNSDLFLSDWSGYCCAGVLWELYMAQNDGDKDKAMKDVDKMITRWKRKKTSDVKSIARDYAVNGNAIFGDHENFLCDMLKDLDIAIREIRTNFMDCSLPE